MRARPHIRPLLVFCCAVSMMAARCNTSTPPPQLVTGGLCGGGTLTTGGAAQDYHIVSEESHLYILSRRKDAVACSQFHHHAVAAPVTRFQFALNKDNPGASTLSATAEAGALDPDRPEYRAAFPVTAAGEAPSDSERSQIKVSVLEQVKAGAHRTLVFSASQLTTLDGDGTAQLQVSLAGGTSTVTFNGRAQMEGDRLILTGTGTINGDAHDIPSGTFKN